jgi:iron(III) transport system ATP-binding protein
VSAATRALEVEGLHASYGATPVLHGVDLRVRGGGLACVLGASGCGKTTLLRVLAGFLPAGRGRVRIGATVVDDGRRRMRPEQRRIGYVPQEGAMFPHLSVAGNVGFGLSGRGGRRRREREARVAELLELVGLGGTERCHPHQLSGGQQQRVALARALACEPELVLLDEPFSSLDAALRARLRADVRAILRATGVTAVLVTHDQTEALSLADTVAVIRDGRVVQSGEPAAVYGRPADAAVAEFVGEATLLPATIAGGALHTTLGRIVLDPACTVDSGPALAVVRPEQVLVTPGGAGTLRGRVASSEYQGNGARLELLVDTERGALALTARTRGGVAVEPGAAVGVEIDGPLWAVPGQAPTYRPEAVNGSVPSTSSTAVKAECARM